MLKKVQVPPGLVLAVVGRTAGNAALRAGEAAAPGEIQVDSSRLAVASKSLFVTTHGGSMPSAIRNKSVSRTHYLLCSGFATSHHSSGALPPNPRDI